MSYINDSRFISSAFRIRNRYEWTKFKSISRLEKKYDDTMTEYYKGFIALCKKVCGLKLTEEEGKNFSIVSQVFGLRCLSLIKFSSQNWLTSPSI